MNIVFHAHHAAVRDSVRERADGVVRKLAARVRGATDALVRFVEDGTVKRVEIVVRAARRRPLVAAGSGARFETALAQAVERLGGHVARVRAERARRLRRAGLRARTLRPNAEVGEHLAVRPDVAPTSVARA